MADVANNGLNRLLEEALQRQQFDCDEKQVPKGVDYARRARARLHARGDATREQRAGLRDTAPIKNPAPRPILRKDPSSIGHFFPWQSYATAVPRQSRRRPRMRKDSR